MERVFVERACHMALDAHETAFVNYNDALRSAERIYTYNWKMYRINTHRWTARDEDRLARFTLPHGVARKIFDSDVEIQRMLASRDDRLPLYRDKLTQVLVSHTTATSTPRFEPVLRDFIDFCHRQNTNTYRWRASFGHVKCNFPGRDTWAIWLCLRDMWDHLDA